MSLCKKIRRAIVLLLFALPFVNGCVMTPRAQSDSDWQRMNPNYRSPIEPDPRPQWGIFSVPNS